MTAKQLILKLADVPPDTPVLIDYIDGDGDERSEPALVTIERDLLVSGKIVAVHIS